MRVIILEIIVFFIFMGEARAQIELKFGQFDMPIKVRNEVLRLPPKSIEIFSGTHQDIFELLKNGKIQLEKSQR